MCYNLLMDKKQTVSLVFLVIITLGLAAGAVYLQQTHSIHTDAAVKTAQAQRASAIKEVTQHDAANKLLLQSANSEISTLQSTKIQLCATLTKAKLTSTLCQ